MCLFLIVCSCGRKEKKEEVELISLRLNLESYPAIEESDYKVDFEVIPLENRDDCLTVKIDRIEIYDEKIYLKSLKEKYVMIFRVDGKFLKHLPIGRGPGEIFFPWDILIDTVNRQLEVLDAYRAIKRYDLEGNYIDEVQFKESNIEFEKLGDRYILYSANFNNKK